MAGFSEKFRRLSLAIVVVTMLITGALVVNLIYNPPTFNTDLDAFVPDSEANSAHERIHQNFPNESRPLFVNVEPDDNGNILEMENIQTMLQHYLELQNLSASLGDSVVVWTTTPSILQTALDEEANGIDLASLSEWNQLVDMVIDEDVECRLTSDDQFLSAATYASSALLNRDLDINPTCDYLATGSGNSTLFASSTLWVLEIDPELSEEDRKSVQIELRKTLAGLSEDSDLSYGVVSLDLLSSDIDDRTLDNVTLLVFLALIVVVILLVFTFRSFRDVTFPLVGLTSALIWTYGLLNVIGVEFSALEVAVAPLALLGLGIDYAIHLQRANSTLREQYPDPAESWLRACAKLSVPLSLAVITTVAAFLANMISRSHR